MPYMDGQDDSPYSVTMKSEQMLSDIQDSDEYEEDDSAAIFAMLRDNMKPVDFGWYLKQYVYTAAGYRKDFSSVTLDEYIDTIAGAFSEKGVPSSIRPSSTRLRAAVKNWLTQRTVSREAVIMLGFGLDMTFEDVTSFLTKALQESTLNPKDPVEAISAYCFRNRLGYFHFRDLLAKYEALPGTDGREREISTTSTVVLRTEVNEICDEKTLLRYLNQLRRIDGKSRQSVEARFWFDKFYDEAREIIAGLNNDMEEDKTDLETDRLADRLSRNDRLYEDQKQERLQNLAGRKKKWLKEEIMPGHFEEILFSAVPRDRNGNLLPMKGSALNEQFRGKRLNRQHLQEVLDGTGTITRYDLATLCFFVLSQKKELENDSVRRYRIFTEQTNLVLDRCGMGKLYAANPYEAFLMICMLTDYPLGTYADVWEMSYE